MATPAAKKVKLEHEGTPAPSSSTPTPAPTTYSTTAQWSTGQIPIDPALQQQSAPPAVSQHIMYPHFQTYAQASHHYASQYTHYQQYQPPQVATPAPTTAPTPATTTTPAAPPAATTPAPTLAVAQAPVVRQPAVAPQQQQAANTNANSNDIATLNDALGSAGVDLRAEEEHLSRSQDHHTSYRSHEDRSRRQPATPNFDSRNLQSKMSAIGKQHRVNRIPEDSVQYMALALRTRLQTLVTAMIEAANHRAEAQFDRTPALYDDQSSPMWSVVVRRDTKRILEVLERVEREEEMKIRRERKQREEAAAQAAADAAAAAASSGANGSGGEGDGAAGEDVFMAPADGTPGKKTKKKKEGPGVTARNLSEDVQKRLSNAVATQAAGLSKGKYAWMNAGAVTGAGKGKAAAAAALAASTSANGATNVSTDSSSSSAAANAVAPAASSSPSPLSQPQSTSTWAKPYVSSSLRNVSPATVAETEEKGKTLTMRDAMFVVERERGHGGGRGAAKGWV